MFNFDDSLHNEAVSLFDSITWDILVPDFIIIEVTWVLHNRIWKNESVLFLDLIENTDKVDLMHFTEHDIKTFVFNYKNNSDKKLSFVDSCLLCLSYEYEIITFDKILKSKL